MEKKYTDKQVQEFLNKNDTEWNKYIEDKYILISNHKIILNKLESRRKKEFRVLLRSIQNLNKIIKKLKSQEEFLNELLDKRELEIKELTMELKNWKTDLNKELIEVTS